MSGWHCDIAQLNFNFRSSIEESYNIEDEKHSTSDSVDYTDNNVEIGNVVETDDASHDTVDDLHPLINQEVLAFLRNEDHSQEVDICDNNNIDTDIGRY